MFDDIAILKTANALAAHAGQRQTLAARNVAHADTPGYRAMDLPRFSDIYASRVPAAELRTTRAGHLAPTDAASGGTRAMQDEGEAAPNGNTVSLEREMIRGAAIRFEHDLAMSVFSKARDILRTSLGSKR